MKLRLFEPVEDRYVEICVDQLITLHPNLEEISAYQIDELEQWVSCWSEAIAHAKMLLRGSR